MPDPMTVALYAVAPEHPQAQPIAGTILTVELAADEGNELRPYFAHEVRWDGPWLGVPRFMALRSPAGVPMAVWPVTLDPRRPNTVAAPAGWPVPMPDLST